MRFKTRALAVVGRIYQLIGDLTGPSDIDVASPIQFVHDVSRESELGSGVGQDRAGGNWVIILAVTVHGAANQQYSTPINPRTAILAATGFVVPDDFDVWLMGVFGYSVGFGFDLSNLTAFWGGLPGTTDSPGELIYQSIDTITQADILGTGDAFAPGYTASPGQFLGPNLPLFLPRGMFFTARQTSLGATTLTLYGRVWVGPVGVRPPGVA